MPLLDCAGHRVLAPDLLGLGRDPTPLASITVDDWADQIAALATAQDEPVILAGHSRGGIVISAAAERAPEHIQLLVYIAAVLTVPGETLFETLEKAGGMLDDAELPRAFLEDGTIAPPRAEAGRIFYNNTTREWAERAASLLNPEQPQVFTAPLNLTAKRYGSIQRAYIECTADRAIPIHAQRAMQRRQPCDPVITMATDHSPFYSDPDGLAAILGRIARDR